MFGERSLSARRPAAPAAQPAAERRCPAPSPAGQGEAAEEPVDDEGGFGEGRPEPAAAPLETEPDSEDGFGEGRPEPVAAPLETELDLEDGFGEGRPEPATAPLETELGKGQMGSALMGSQHCLNCFLTEGPFGYSR